VAAAMFTFHIASLSLSSSHDCFLYREIQAALLQGIVYTPIVVSGAASLKVSGV
jgi:hypothetical protein